MLGDLQEFVKRQLGIFEVWVGQAWTGGTKTNRLTKSN